MNNHLKKIFGLMITFIMGLSLMLGTSCSQKGDLKSESLSESSESSSSNNVVEKEYSNNYLVQNKRSNYKVLVPNTMLLAESTAASQLVEYVFQASNVSLQIVSEKNEMNVTTNGYYISIGNTNLYKKQLFVAENLNEDGFILKTVNNTLFIIGENDNGTLYGVYEFLEKQIGIKFLTDYNEYVPIVNEIRMYNFNDIEIPSFSHRTYFYQPTQDPKFCSKMRFYSATNFIKTEEEYRTYGCGYSKDYYASGHSMENFVKYSDFHESHPEWFSNNSTATHSQPCWSNSFNVDGTKKEGDTFYNEFLNEVFELVNNYGEVLPFIALNQADNNNCCTCDECLKLKEALGGKESGIYVLFMNTLSIDLIKKLREAGNPQDDLKFEMMAYQFTEASPTHKDESGKYVADCELVIPNDNIYINYAPTTACYLHSLDDEECSKNHLGAYAQIEGWRSICNNFHIFQYGTNFNGCLIWYPHEGALVDNFHYWKEIGVSSLLVEGLSVSQGYYQADLDCYIFSKLMWNIDRNITEIVSEFNHYMFGGPAGELIDDFYSYMNVYFTNCAKQSNGHLGIYLNASPWITTIQTLNKNMILGAYNIYDNAVAAINNDETLSQNYKEKYLYNMKKIKVQLMYMQYKVYDSVWATTDTEKLNFMLEFFDLCDEVNLTRFGEGHIVSEYRKNELGDL